MKRQDYVFGSTTSNVTEQTATELNNGWAELSILYSRVLNGALKALSSSTNDVSQEVANAIVGMGTELNPLDSSQLLSILQTMALKASDFESPITASNKGATMKEIEEVTTSSLTFKGFVGTSQPTQIATTGNIWINSATMPTNFPVAASSIKQWNGTSWVAYGSDFTPADFDFFRNNNNNEGYYWFGGEWKIMSTDMSTEYFTLNQTSGKWELKDSLNLPGQPTTQTPDGSNPKSLVTVDYVSTNTLSSKSYTNCPVIVPQDIQLELANGVLTLKAGSKVYVPNGAGVFDIETVNVDIPFSLSANGTYMLFKQQGQNAIDYVPPNRALCGPNISIGDGFGDYAVAYKTEPNSCGLYENDGKSNYNLIRNESLPICVFTVSNGAISSIDQVFNGFGYIDSTIFVLPGVKGLVPNGRNTDGTLKNTTRTTTAVSVYTASSVVNDYEYQLAYNGTLAPFYSHMTYNAEENINYNANGTPSAWAIFGSAKFNNNAISEFNPKTAFHAVDYNDWETLKNTITIAAPAGMVTPFAGKTAPSGWLKCDGSAVSRTRYAALFAAIGTLYGAGDGSTTFNLPNLTGRVPFGMTGDYIGKSTEGVLPNITGKFMIGATDNTNDYTGGILGTEGAFSSDWSASNHSLGGGSGYSTNRRAIFDASRSSALYNGAAGWYGGAKVVPASVGMNYCIKY